MKHSNALSKWVIALCFLLPYFYVNAFATELLNSLSNMNTVQAHFTQTIEDAHGRGLSQSKGELWIQKPGLFRLEISQPMVQIIVADGKQVWNYQPDLQQVIVQPLSNTLQATPLSLLSGDSSTLEKLYSISYPSVNILLLTAKQKNSFYKIQLNFKNDQIQSMILFDLLDQKTFIQFDQVAINRPIDKKLFHFSPPEGVDIIKN